MHRPPRGFRYADGYAESGEGLDIASMVLVFMRDEDATEVSRPHGFEEIDFHRRKGGVDQDSPDQIRADRIADEATTAIGEHESHDVAVALGSNHESPVRTPRRMIEMPGLGR
jgi:hypothetical protein